MLIKDRTYSTESCSTSVSTLNSVTHANVHNSLTDWYTIGGGYFLPSTVYSGGSNGDGAEHIFQVLHNGEEVQIILGLIDLTSLDPSNSLAIVLTDSAGFVLTSNTSAPGTMFYLPPPMTFDAINYSQYRLKFIINNSGFGQSATLSGFDISQDQTIYTQLCQDDEYRFGFNGQEKDNEVSGVGNSMTAEFWQYDSRLGRRWNTDPVVKEWESSYTSFNNNPVTLMDPNGDDAETPNAGRIEGPSVSQNPSISQGNVTPPGGPGDPITCPDHRGKRRFSIHINFSWLVKKGTTYQRAPEFEGTRLLSPVQQPTPGAPLIVTINMPNRVRDGDNIQLAYNAFGNPDIFVLQDQLGRSIINPNDPNGTGVSFIGTIPIPTGTTSISLSITPANPGTGSSYTAVLIQTPNIYVYSRKYVAIFGIQFHYGRVRRWDGATSFSSTVTVTNGRRHRNKYNRDK